MKLLREEEKMNYIKGYRCTICHKFFHPDEVNLTCPECGEKGILTSNMIMKL